MNGLKDKVVVVIGGSSGIGLRVAELAAQQEAKVIITGRDSKRLANACESLTKHGARLDAMRLDAHKARELEYFFSSLPEFDHLVSMVGDVMGGRFSSGRYGCVSTCYRVEVLYECSYRKTCRKKSEGRW